MVDNYVNQSMCRLIFQMVIHAVIYVCSRIVHLLFILYVYKQVWIKLGKDTHLRNIINDINTLSG